MAEFVWKLIEFMVCVVEMVMLYFLCSKKLGKRESFNKLHVLIGIFVASGIVYAATEISLYSVWKSATAVVVMTLFSLIMFERSLKDKAINIIIYTVIMAFSDLSAILLTTFIRKVWQWDIVLLPNMDRLIMIVVAKFICILAILYVAQFNNKSKTDIPKRFWVFFISTFGAFLVLFMLMIDVGMTIEANELLTTIMFALVLALLVFYLMVYYFFDMICGYFANKSIIDMLAYQNETIEKYILQKQESDKVIKIMCHDLKHNLNRWKLAAENNGYEEIMNEIAEYEQNFKGIELIDVENEIANAIINQKLMLARSKGIAFNVRGSICPEIKISKPDMCGLFGNLLDNAMEAVMKLDADEERRIDVEIKRIDKVMFLSVKNNYKDEPIADQTHFITRKKNRQLHGIGLTSVRHTCEKYLGMMEINYKDHIFVIEVALKAY